jgi:integrase
VHLGDEHVATWLKGGRNLTTCPRYACSSTTRPPCPPDDSWTATRSRSWAYAQAESSRHAAADPGRDRRFVALADELTPPSFAAYLHTAVYEGMRPGELDALRWDRIDFQAGTILVDEQWNSTSHRFTLPKHGAIRTIALTDPVRERLLSLPRESEFVSTTLRGSHYRPSSRSHHWNRVRCSAGLPQIDLYTATRHHFGWYAWNVLELDARDIALHFGHQDGGELVRKLYGHADEKLARERVREAFRHAPPAPVPLVGVGR